MFPLNCGCVLELMSKKKKKKHFLKDNATEEQWITDQKNIKDEGHTKLSDVISLVKLLVKNAHRQAEMKGRGYRLTSNPHSLLHYSTVIVTICNYIHQIIYSRSVCE